jgi:hypothetical protein
MPQISKSALACLMRPRRKRLVCRCSPLDAFILCIEPLPKALPLIADHDQLTWRSALRVSVVCIANVT